MNKSGRDWVEPFKAAAKKAIAETVERLSRTDDMSEFRMNDLAAISALVAHTLRRELLEKLLREHQFNMTKTAITLRCGDHNSVKRMCNELGLAGLLETRVTKGRPKGCYGKLRIA